MKLKLIGLAALTLAATVVRAQGTAADYKRAYSLQSKFQQKTVAHWAHDIGWKDSSSVLHYYIDTQDGRRYISYDVASGVSKTYNSEREMKKALGMKERRNANGQRTYNDPFRHKESFWMDTYYTYKTTSHFICSLLKFLFIISLNVKTSISPLVFIILKRISLSKNSKNVCLHKLHG